MDNDIKIIKNDTKDSRSVQRHEDVLLFLNKELCKLEQKKGVKTYNLEDEYAKTKKNKSAFAIVVLVISVIAVALIAFTMTKIINKQNEKIAVNVEEFDDLNLKSLLASVSKVQTNYEEAIKNKTLLEKEQDSARKNAEMKRDGDLFLIDSLNLDDQKEIDKRKNKILEEYNQTLEEISAEYSEKIQLAQTEIENIGSQLKQYDASDIEAAREQEISLDSERQVQELEMERLSQRYEKRITELEITLADERKVNAANLRKALKEVSDKYKAEIALLDPVLSDSKSNQIISSFILEEDNTFDSESILSDNEISDTTIQNGLAKYQKDYDNYKYLRQPVAAIPHKNSVPDYISTTNKLVDNMSQTFEDTALSLYGEKQELYSEISGLEENIRGLEKDIENLKIEMKNKEDEHQKEKDSLKSSLMSDFGKPLEGLLAGLKTNAAVISKDSKENIIIFVSEKARYLITEETHVEIKGSKSVKGRLSPAQNPGYYQFMSLLDDDGNPIDFDDTLISCGNTVKILAK